MCVVFWPTSPKSTWSLFTCLCCPWLLSEDSITEVLFSADWTPRNIDSIPISWSLNPCTLLFSYWCRVRCRQGPMQAGPRCRERQCRQVRCRERRCTKFHPQQSLKVILHEPIFFEVSHVNLTMYLLYLIFINSMAQVAEPIIRLAPGQLDIGQVLLGSHHIATGIFLCSQLRVVLPYYIW